LLFYEYISGVIGAITAEQGWYGAAAPFCISRNATYQQIGDIVTKLLIDDSRDRHLPASSVIGLAMSGVFPCQQR
jgi:hypothetical protein